MKLFRCHSKSWLLYPERRRVRCEKNFLHALFERGSWHRFEGALWKPYRGIR